MVPRNKSTTSIFFFYFFNHFIFFLFPFSTVIHFFFLFSCSFFFFLLCASLLPQPNSTNKPRRYYELKWSKYCRRENIIPERKKWWANANILCNELGEDSTKIEWWGDSHLAQLRDMLESLCNRALTQGKTIPNVEFFLNKRDHPQLKRDLTEPYDFIFDDGAGDGIDSPDIERCRYTNYAPIFSYYCGDRFADLPLPLSEDWSSATGTLYPETTQLKFNKKTGEEMEPKINDLYFAENFQKFYKPWEQKKPTAFFRGNMTVSEVKFSFSFTCSCSSFFFPV